MARHSKSPVPGVVVSDPKEYNAETYFAVKWPEVAH
jgi:hypothetical protein